MTTSSEVGRINPDSANALVVDDYIETTARLQTTAVVALGHIVGKMSPAGSKISLQAVADHLKIQQEKLSSADLVEFRKILAEQISISKILVEFSSAAITSAVTELQAEAYSRIALSHTESIRRSMNMLKDLSPTDGDPSVIAETLM
ncbi:hypothetical protein ACFL17_06285 [Pseudomonadota bacterium]